MWCADEWKDYTLIDAAGGEKLEYWKNVLLRRPDPQAIWTERSAERLWNKTDATYRRSSSGGGHWEIFNKKMPERWTVSYKDLTFNIKPMGFKHTGLFPEQAVNWDWFSEIIKKAEKPVRILMLIFGGLNYKISAILHAIRHLFMKNIPEIWRYSQHFVPLQHQMN